MYWYVATPDKLSSASTFTVIELDVPVWLNETVGAVLSNTYGPAPVILWLPAWSIASTHKYLFPSPSSIVTSLSLDNVSTKLSACGCEFVFVTINLSELSSKLVSVTFTCAVWLFSGVVSDVGVIVMVGNVLSKLNELVAIWTVVFPAKSFASTHK